jgi:hypothetical protein
MKKQHQSERLDMTRSVPRRRLLAASAGIAFLALAGHTGSTALAADFSGQTIEFLIPFEVGGGPASPPSRW